ncbi:hypothetical protein [Acidovorax sp. sic0104]|uniref:hypothetical protein n=1 Tax=Acidovorax sp. sic0104 TaxID=2854784 RepID=UPI001C478217|nr:hypothetical protein [Acidovorax sp. sic0104]MBV7542072.1 hypothetical protein [Acidovorax sp. sic0104]
MHRTAATTPFQPNDRVNWQHESNRPDAAMVYGYGMGLPIPARVVKLGAKRVQIELKTKPPYVRDSWWESQLKWVDASTLSPRALPCAAFNEPMQHVHEGFVLTGWKHPHGRSQVFPNGTWYAAVAGYTCGAPCATEEQAVRDALHCLLTGGYRTSLLSSIAVREHWIATGQDKNGVGAAELPELKERLATVEMAFPPRTEPAA